MFNGSGMEDCNLPARAQAHAGIAGCTFAPTHAPSNAPAAHLVRTDSDIKAACAAWNSDAASAAATYGHIKDWDTSGVTNMTESFGKEPSR